MYVLLLYENQISNIFYMYYSYNKYMYIFAAIRRLCEIKHFTIYVFYLQSMIKKYLQYRQLPKYNITIQKSGVLVFFKTIQSSARSMNLHCETVVVEGRRHATPELCWSCTAFQLEARAHSNPPLHPQFFAGSRLVLTRSEQQTG